MAQSLFHVQVNMLTKDSYASEGHWCIDAMLGGVA